MRPRSAAVAAAAAAAATALALASAVNSGPKMWNRLGDAYRGYAGYTDAEREHAPLVSIGLTPDVFDFYRERIVRGDRVYLQVGESGLGAFLDQPTAARYLSRFYFLPAVVTDDLADATVVVTHFDDPGKLGVEFVTQQRAGLQPFFVSRIRAP